MTSHLGQPIADHVVLLCTTGTSGALNCRRVFPNGMDAAFTIPTNKALVVTDVIWWGFRSKEKPGTTIELQLDTGSSGVFVDHAVVTRGRIFRSSAHMTAGLVYSSTAALRASSVSESFHKKPKGDKKAPRYYPYIAMYGYLIDAVQR